MSDHGPLRRIVAALAVAAATVQVQAHSGPPFPIVTDRVAGPYRLSIWTDPDTTDDGSPGGQFWIVLEPSDRTVPVPPATRAHVSIRPLDRAGPARTARAEPAPNAPDRHFAALLMDHEGRFAVRTTIEGPLGSASVDAEVDATYDLRPPPILIAVYLMPFVLVGFLWLKLLSRRRRARAQA